MIIKHLGKSPRIHPGAWIAPDATVCGDVEIADGCRVAFGARLISEGAPMRLGKHCVIMENAVLRAPEGQPLSLGDHCLVGPQAHLVGCQISDRVFVATGASVFHGAQIGKGAELRINSVVHIKTRLAEGATVPIGWVAVGDPAQILPAADHNQIWALQEPLNFPKTVYGIERGSDDVMGQITRKRSTQMEAHRNDVEIS